jgi:hypothetical protein
MVNSNEQPDDRLGFLYLAVGRWAGMTTEQIEADIPRAEDETAEPITGEAGTQPRPRF